MTDQTNKKCCPTDKELEKYSGPIDYANQNAADPTKKENINQVDFRNTAGIDNLQGAPLNIQGAAPRKENITKASKEGQHSTTLDRIVKDMNAHIHHHGEQQQESHEVRIKNLSKNPPSEEQFHPSKKDQAEMNKHHQTTIAQEQAKEFAENIVHVENPGPLDLPTNQSAVNRNTNTGEVLEKKVKAVFQSEQTDKCKEFEQVAKNTTTAANK